MKDSEKDKVLIERVMGWERCEPHLGSWWMLDGKMVAPAYFSPRNSSADCDALIEAVLKTGVLEMDSDERTIVIYYRGYKGESDWQGEYTTLKKNNAVVEAIWQTVDGGEG